MEPIQITYEDIIERYKARMSELEYQLMFKEAESDAKTQRITELEAALEATKAINADNKGAKKNEK